MIGIETIVNVLMLDINSFEVKNGKKPDAIFMHEFLAKRLMRKFTGNGIDVLDVLDRPFRVYFLGISIILINDIEDIKNGYFLGTKSFIEL